jgi:hypothetical protein
VRRKRTQLRRAERVKPDGTGSLNPEIRSASSPSPFPDLSSTAYTPPSGSTPVVDDQQLDTIKRRYSVFDRSFECYSVLSAWREDELDTAVRIGRRGEATGDMKEGENQAMTE